MKPVEAVLWALRTDATARGWSDWLKAQDIDADEVAVTALALGLAPMLHYRLEQWGTPLAEPRAQAKLAYGRQQELARQQARQAQLAEALALLPLDRIVLKGAYLADCIYPAPGTRPMSDIDILFRPEDLPTVSQVLHRLGYASREKPADFGPGITKHTATFKRAGQPQVPNPYLDAGVLAMIEPHRSLEESWFGLKCDLTPRVWERSQPAQISGQPVRVLAPADCLLHLCVHLVFHLIMGSPAFVQLLDLSVVASRSELDWDDLLARAAELRASGYAYAALRLAARELGAPVPQPLLERLRLESKPSVAAVADTISLSDVLRRTQRAPLQKISQRLGRGLADRAETSRWAHSTTEWLRIWWTLVDVRRTDTWRVLITRAKT
jgi:hypothetical protein